MICHRVAAALPVTLIPVRECGPCDTKPSRLARNAIAPPARGFGLPGAQEISCLVLPIPVHVFERPLFRKVGHHFFQRRRLTTQILHRARSCHTRRIAARRCLSVPRKSLDPPCTLRRQYRGRLSSKDTLVALQSLLDDSIFSADGYSGMFWRRMSFRTRSGGTCPVRISVSSMLLADEPEIPHRPNRQFVSDAVTARPDEPEPRFSKTLISPQILAPYNWGRLYRKSGRRSLPRASHRIEGSVYWLPAPWCRPVARQRQGRKWEPPLQAPRRSQLQKSIFSFESRSLRLAPAALNVSYVRPHEL